MYRYENLGVNILYIPLMHTLVLRIKGNNKFNKQKAG